MRDECKMRNWFSMDGPSEEREFLVEPAAGSGLPDPLMNAFGGTKVFGGAGRDRTDDLKLAKLPLSQLSYGPTKMVGLGGLEPPTSRLSSARSNQLSYKPKLSRAAHDKSPQAWSREGHSCSARSGTRP